MDQLTNNYKQLVYHLNTMLSIPNQDINRRHDTETVAQWLRYNWCVAFLSTWIIVYSYLMFTQTTSIQSIAYQFIIIGTLIQVTTKYGNRLVFDNEFRKLFEWFEGIYCNRAAFGKSTQTIVDQRATEAIRMSKLFFK